VAIQAYEKRAGRPWSDDIRTALRTELDRQERVEDKAATALRTLRSAVNASMKLAENIGFDPTKPNWGKTMAAGPFGELMNWLARNQEAIRTLAGSRATRRTTPADRHRRLIVELFLLDPTGVVRPELEASMFEGAVNIGTGERPLKIVRLPGHAGIRRRSDRELAAMSVLSRSEHEDVLDGGDGGDARDALDRETRAISAVRRRLERAPAHRHGRRTR